MTILFNRQRLNPFSSIAGILLMAIVLVGLFFLARVSGSLTSLFGSDGSESGTINLTPNNPFSSDGCLLYASNDLLFFTPGGKDVWRSDGTIPGTYPVWLGENSEISIVSNGDGTIYFRVRRPGRSDELWFSDGSAENTYLAYQMNAPDFFPGFIQRLTSIGGTAYFVATDGAQGTRVLGLKSGCSWQLGSPISQSSGVFVSGLVSTDSQVFLYMRDNEILNRLLVYKPPLPVLRDPELRRLVVGAYDVNLDTVIDEGEMRMVNHLDISHHGIRDLTGLENFRELAYLDASFNLISDLKPLILQGMKSNSSMDEIIMSNNLLDQDDCLDIGVLSNQLAQSNGKLVYQFQGGFHFQPAWTDWPQIGIHNFINGMDAQETRLDCQGER